MLLDPGVMVHDFELNTLEAEARRA
jgi:hypothetical protein